MGFEAFRRIENVCNFKRILVNGVKHMFSGNDDYFLTLFCVGALNKSVDWSRDLVVLGDFGESMSVAGSLRRSVVF